MYKSQAKEITHKKTIQQIKPFLSLRLNASLENKPDFIRLLVKRYKLPRNIHVEGLEKKKIDPRGGFIHPMWRPNRRGANNAENSNDYRRVLTHRKKVCIMAKNIKYCCSLSIENGYGNATDKWMLKIIKRLSNVTSLKLKSYSNKAGIKQKNECLYHLKRLKNLQMIENEKINEILEENAMIEENENLLTPKSFKLQGSSSYQNLLTKLNAISFQTLDFCDTVNTKSRRYSYQLQELGNKCQSLKSFRIWVCITPNSFVSFGFLVQKLNGGPEKISISGFGFNITWENVLGNSNYRTYSSYFSHVLKLNEKYASEIVIKDREFLRGNLERMTLLDILKLTSTLGVQNLEIHLNKGFQVGQPFALFDLWEILPTCYNLISLDIKLPVLSQKSIYEFVRVINGMKLKILQIVVLIDDKDVVDGFETLLSQSDRSQTVILIYEACRYVTFEMENGLSGFLRFYEFSNFTKKENESEVCKLKTYKIFIPDKLVKIVKLCKANVKIELTMPFDKESEVNLCLEKIVESFISENIIERENQIKTESLYAKTKIGLTICRN